MTAPTALQRKRAVKQALAILTAAYGDRSVDELFNAQGDELVLVAAALAGLCGGVLRAMDEHLAGAGAAVLAGIGPEIERMDGGAG